jgi:hypothetical protein
MYDQDKWFGFMQSANKIVQEGQKINDLNPNIQLVLQPSFDNHFSLQLCWEDQNILWYRTTWLKLVDAPNFSNPIESLKYIGKDRGPSIKYENGRIPLESGNNILDLAKATSIKPNLDKWGGIILDGCYYILTFAVESNSVTYKWSRLPDNWADLENLVNAILRLNETLIETAGGSFTQ